MKTCRFRLAGREGYGVLEGASGPGETVAAIVRLFLRGAAR